MRGVHLRKRRHGRGDLSSSAREFDLELMFVIHGHRGPAAGVVHYMHRVVCSIGPHLVRGHCFSVPVVGPRQLSRSPGDFPMGGDRFGTDALAATSVVTVGGECHGFEVRRRFDGDDFGSRRRCGSGLHGSARRQDTGDDRHCSHERKQCQEDHAHPDERNFGAAGDRRIQWVESVPCWRFPFKAGAKPSRCSAGAL